MWSMLVLFLANVVRGQFRGQNPLFLDPSNCTTNEYFAPHNYSCVPCPQNLVASTDHLTCQCSANNLISNFTASGPVCIQCQPGEVGVAGRCIPCPSGNCQCSQSQILTQNGCSSCPANMIPSSDKTSCLPCQSLSCLCLNGTCSQGQGEPKTEIWLSDGGSLRSLYIEREFQGIVGRCQLGSNVDCQALLNMCVLQHFDRSSQTSCSIADRNTPYFSTLIVSGDPDSELHKETAVPIAFGMDQPIEIVVALFHRNGSFLRMSSFPSALVCSFPEKLVLMGRRFAQLCPVDVLALLEEDRQIFVELFIKFKNDQGESRTYPVSIFNKQMRGNGQYVNQASSNRQELTRRFFLVDNSGTFPNSSKVLRYVNAMELQINLQPTRDGHIYPPLLVVDYSEVLSDINEAMSRFSVVFASDPERHDRDLEITMAVLCPTSVIWAGLKTYSWGRRSGKQLISDASVVIQFLLFSATCLGEVFFLIPSIIAVWLTFAYKSQYYVFYNVLTSSQENTLRIYLLCAVILKAAGVVQKVWQLINQKTIFVDWERTRTVLDQTNRPPSQDAAKAFKDLPPIAWRTYMVANEWNELFSYRKTSVILQMMTMLVLLEHFGWKNWALVEPGFHSSQHGSVETTNLTKLGVFVAVYLFLAILQWVIQVLILERLLDPFHNFIDLCSVANISVLSLTHSLYGYYVHGRSVHGRGDVSMGEMNEFLKRERDNLCANRGLEPGTELQTFHAALPVSFQDKLENIYSSHVPNANLRGFDRDTATMDKTTLKHEIVNNFVKEFVDHSLNEIEYTTRDATFVESLLDVETNDTTFTGHFTRDPSEMSFSRCFLYGNEWTFLSFEVALFCSLALWLDSLPLTCFIVFLTATLIRLLCSSIAKLKLATVSLVDERFLL